MSLTILRWLVNFMNMEWNRTWLRNEVVVEEWKGRGCSHCTPNLQPTVYFSARTTSNFPDISLERKYLYTNTLYHLLTFWNAILNKPVDHNYWLKNDKVRMLEINILFIISLRKNFIPYETLHRSVYVISSTSFYRKFNFYFY